MTLKKLACAMLAMVCAVSIAACGTADSPDSGGNTPATSADTGAPVTLKWMIGSGGTNPSDSAEVWAAVNQKLQEHLPGTTLDMTCVSFGDYEQRWQLEAASGAQWDIAWFGWMLNLSNEVSNGALMPLNDLLDKYGQDLRKELAQFMFDCNTINGQVYLIPNNQIAATPASGFIAPSELIDKHMDVAAFEKSAKEWEDSDLVFPPASFLDAIEEYMKNCLAAGDLQMGYNAGYFPGFLGNRNTWYQFKMEEHVAAFTKAHDNTSKVYSYADIVEEEIAYYERVKKWYDMGFIRKDGMTLESAEWEKLMEYYPEGNGIVFTTHNYDKYRAEMDSAHYGFPITVLPVLYPKAPTGTNPTATSECIMSGAKNPDRAMQFLNFFHSAAGTEIYNMMVYGLEGTHWEFRDKDAGIIETLDYTGRSTGEEPYTLPKWAIGNTYYVYAPQGTDPEYDKYMSGEFNRSAMSMPLSGFVLDTQDLIVETAAFLDIMKEFTTGLKVGVYPNVRTAIEERNARLESAGCLKIASEMQKQVDAFLANK